MITIILAALLAGPPPVKPCDTSTVIGWRLCQPRVINLGAWDPRPLEWPYSTYYEPKEWGEYPTEKR